MIKFLAQAISYILHPLLMPVLGIWLIFRANTYMASLSLEIQNWLLLIVFGATCFIPLMVMPILFSMRLIKSAQLETTQERVIPLSITLLGFSFAYYMLVNFPVSLPQFPVHFILGSLIVVFLVTLITFKWKISAHTAGIGGLAGSLIALSLRYQTNYLLIISMVVLAAGLLGSARIYLKSHSPAQVYAGFYLGFTILLGINLFL